MNPSNSAGGLSPMAVLGGVAVALLLLRMRASGGSIRLVDAAMVVLGAAAAAIYFSRLRLAAAGVAWSRGCRLDGLLLPVVGFGAATTC